MRMHTHTTMHMTMHMRMPRTRHGHAMDTPYACHATRHTRCADYGVVSGYNDDFPQRGLGDRGDEQVLPTEGVPARGRPNRGGSAPVRDFNKNMFQC